MEEIIDQITALQEELEDIKYSLEVQEPKKSVCEIWKDNFLCFINKNIKQL